MGGTTDKRSRCKQGHLEISLFKQITITTEYRCGILNTRTDWFQHICWKMGMPMIDLFASRLCNNIKMFFLESLSTLSGYGFSATRMERGDSILISPVFVNSDSVSQNSKGESQYSNIDNSSMVNSTLVFKSSCNVIFSTFSTPSVLLENCLYTEFFPVRIFLCSDWK